MARLVYFLAGLLLRPLGFKLVFERKAIPTGVVGGWATFRPGTTSNHVSRG